MCIRDRLRQDVKRLEKELAAAVDAHDAQEKTARGAIADKHEQLRRAVRVRTDELRAALVSPTRVLAERAAAARGGDSAGSSDAAAGPGGAAASAAKAARAASGVMRAVNGSPAGGGGAGAAASPASFESSSESGSDLSDFSDDE